MATINNLKGTTYQSFLIGKRGTTVYQGSDIPANVVSSPINGDIYLQKGLSTSDQGLWQYINSSWVQLQTTNSNLSDISDITITPNTVLGVDTSGTSIVALTSTQLGTNLGLGSAAYVSTGTSSGNVPVLDASGKIPVSTLPSIAITDVYSVADNDARDALDAHEGDIAVVTSTSTSYIYDGSSWQAIGSAGSVTGINGPNSTIKTGVVTLDASDILTGTLTVGQGGTGLSTINSGDLLIGGSNNTITVLPISGDGDALVIADGQAQWGKVNGSNVVFAPGSSNLSSADVTSAIIEVSNSRPRITTVVSDPYSGTDNTAGYKIGDVIINTTTGKLFQAIDVTTSSAIWQKIGSTVKPENTLYVAFSGDDTTGDGSASFPYRTITQAISKSSPGSAVLIYPGSYNEDISVNVEDIVIKSMSGNVLVGGAFTTTVDNVLVNDIEFGVISSSTPSISITTNSNIIFKNCSFDSSTPVVISGKTGTGIAFIACSISGSFTVNSTNTDPIVMRDSYGFGLTMSSGTLVVTSSRSINKVTHTGGALYLNDIMEMIKNSNGVSLESSATNSSGNFLYLSNSTLLQKDNSYGSISISGGVSYIVDNLVYDPSATLPDTGRVYGTYSKDIGVQGTFTNITPGSNIQSALESIDSKIGSVSSSVITKFSSLSDVTSYTSDNKNMTVMVNSTGTGITYGPVLGTAAQNQSSDFATAAQGNLASTAVQPSSLSKVATSGKVGDLVDGPGAMAASDSGKVVRVDSAGSSLEYGPTLATVANTGDYSDLINAPSPITVRGDFASSTLYNVNDIITYPAQGANWPEKTYIVKTSFTSTTNLNDNISDVQYIAGGGSRGSMWFNGPGTDTTSIMQYASQNTTAVLQAVSGDYFISTDNGHIFVLSDSYTWDDTGISTKGVDGTSYTNDGSVDLDVKSIKSDNSNILSDGSGNLNIKGTLAAGSFIMPSSTYTDLPSSPVIGQMYLVTNGRKPGEEENAGSGVLCIFDGTNWMDTSSGTTVLI